MTVLDPVYLNKRAVGKDQPCFIVAEIGINHNGSLSTAKQLIDASVACGCDAVKFQKRTVELVYTSEELDKPRESPFGTTNRQLKIGLEFGQQEYQEIDEHCRKCGIIWFASCWDQRSVDFIDQFAPPCFKIPSALLTNSKILKYVRAKGRPVILSTGMSTMNEIRSAVRVLGEEQLVILHCTSSYPATPSELNLKVIESYSKEFPCPIGYSGHEVGLQTTLAAVVVGACMVERHITLDRSMWGTDQPASVEPQGLTRLVRDIRVIETALGDGCKRVYDSELPVRAKLRKVAV